MINEEILKLRSVYEGAKANIVGIINDAYGKGLPFYLINSIIEDIGFQLKPLMDEESKSVQPQENSAEPAPAIEEKGEQEANE